MIQSDLDALGEMSTSGSRELAIANYPTRSLRSLVRYRVEHSKRNSASPHAFVLFFMYFVSVCISGYRMEQNKTLVMAPNLEMSVFAIAHVLLSNLYHIKTHLTVPHVGNN